MDRNYKLRNGNCFDVMYEMEDNSVDAIIRCKILENPEGYNYAAS